jgi:hypothetical protein
MILTMRSVFKIFAALFLVVSSLSASGELPRPVLQALKTAGIPTSSVGAVPATA